MVRTSASNRILALSFEKKVQEMAFYEFEALLVYSVIQTCQFFGDLMVLDYAVPSNRLMLNPTLPFAQKQQELLRLSEVYQCDYVMQGRLTPHLNENGFLAGISIDLSVYHAARNHTALQVTYYYSEFEEDEPTCAKFTTSWHATEDLIDWMASMLVGVVRPLQSNAVWRKLQEGAWCHSMTQLSRLARAHYLNAETALSAKIKLLQTALQEESDLFIGHIELSMLCKRQHDFPQAILHLQAAYDGMKSVIPHQRCLVATELGVCYALIENQEQAIHWWKTAIQTDPGWLNPYLNLAHLYESRNQINEAEIYFKKVQEIAPDDTRTYFNLARIYSKLERWDDAIRQYEFQLLLEPGNVWMYSNLANCHLQQGQVAKAIPYLEKAYNLDPNGEAGKFAGFVLSRLEASAV